MYGLNEERTRYLDAPGVKPPFSIRWRFKGGHLLEYSPILVSNQLFGINNNGLAFAIKTRTGKARWKRQVASLNASAPTFSDGILYISNLEPGQVVALAAYDGHTYWKHPLPGRSESSPLVVGNKVIVGCECNTVYAFNKKTGKTIWETARERRGEGGARLQRRDRLRRRLQRRDDRAARERRLDQVADRARRGRASAGPAQFYATAAVAFGRVYAGNTDGRMYSFDQQTGRLAWSHSTSNYVYAGAVAARTAGHPAHRLLRLLRRQLLRARRAHRRGALEPARRLGSISGAASLIGDTVYVADLQHTSTYGFNAANGHKVFEYRTAPTTR